jgi:uncharacterized repeat protein (TIGR03847 family)
MSDHMPQFELDINPVSHITTDAIGKPGERVFYLQGTQDDRIVTLLIEKIQIQSLAVGVEQFLSEINQKYPELQEASADYMEDKMHIFPPVDPLFRVGEIGLGYDSDNDLMVLVTRELAAGESTDQPTETQEAIGSIGMESEGEATEESGVVRFWCTRSQIRAMCHWGIEVANRGRPICPQCGEPMEPEGHFCPKKNGHKH